MHRPTVGELLSLNSSRRLAWALAGVPYFGSAATQRSASGMESLQAEDFLGQIAVLLLERSLDLGLQAGRPQPQDETWPGPSSRAGWQRAAPAG